MNLCLSKAGIMRPNSSRASEVAPIIAAKLLMNSCRTYFVFMFSLLWCAVMPNH